MREIDIEQELAKYQMEFDNLVKQLQVIEAQRATLMKGISERRGIIIYLQSLNQHKEEAKEKDKE